MGRRYENEGRNSLLLLARFLSFLTHSETQFISFNAGRRRGESSSRPSCVWRRTTILWGRHHLGRIIYKWFNYNGELFIILFHCLRRRRRFRSAIISLHFHFDFSLFSGKKLWVIFRIWKTLFHCFTELNSVICVCYLFHSIASKEIFIIWFFRVFFHNDIQFQVEISRFVFWRIK